MKTKLLFLMITFLCAIQLCAISHVYAIEVSNSINANQDDAFHANSLKKRTYKKKSGEPYDTARPTEYAESESESDAESLHSDAYIIENEYNPAYKHHIRFTLLPSFMTVQGEQMMNDSRGELNSKMYAAIKVDYSFSYKKWVFTFINGYKQITFQQSDDKTVMSQKHKLLRNDLMIGRRFGRATFGVGVGHEDKFFYKIMNTTFADVETRRDIKIYAFGEYNFHKYKNFGSSLNFKAGFNPPENSETYDIKMGYLYSVSLKVNHDINDNNKIGMEVFFKNEDYKTQQLHLKSSEIGLGISFSHDWGAWK